jgi:hypothetical protein
MRLGPVAPLVQDALASPARPLDRETRGAMETAFGHDFRHVRIHDDGRAAKSARAVNARAYTLGSDVVFGAGQYAPGTIEGKRLLAHELTHVVQQRGFFRQGSPELEVSAPTDPGELEAERISREVVRDHPPGAVGTVGLSGAPRLARATYNVGAQRIEIDYSGLPSILPGDYVTEIETRFTAWTGSPASTIHADLTALSQDQKKWVLFALDLLVDNTTAAHAAFDRVQGVQRLIAHAPSATSQPLGAGPIDDFPNEVLRVSGWFEVALPARLTAPTGATLTSVTTLFNPPPGVGAPPGGALDAVRLNAEIPPALGAFLLGIDPATWSSVGTDPIAGIQAIGDQVQAEARSFFSPYADTAIANAYARAWTYSAHITSTLAIVPTFNDRISYLLNRAEIVGRRTQVGGAIFDNCNFDSSRPADQAELLSIVTTMEADPVIQARVNRLVQHTGQTSHPAGGAEVGISTEFNASAITACRARWRTIDTLTHELVHAMVHPSFPASASSVRFGQIIREGFTEALGVQLFESIRARAGADAAFKGRMEAGVAPPPCPAPAAATIDYGQAGANAESIRTLVGDDNFRAAYFLGAVRLVGL